MNQTKNCRVAAFRDFGRQATIDAVTNVEIFAVINEFFDKPNATKKNVVWSFVGDALEFHSDPPLNEGIT